MADYKSKIDQLITESCGDLPGIKDVAMQKTVKTVINNTLKLLKEDAPATVTGSMDQYTPVIINLIRRTLPTLVGPQMIGMQAMNMPTGRIFVQRIYALDKENDRQYELWGGLDEPNAVSGSISGRQPLANPATGNGMYNNSGTQIPMNSSANSAGLYADPSSGFNKPNSDNPYSSPIVTNGKFTGTYRTNEGEQLGWKHYGNGSTEQGGNFTLAHYPEMTFGIDSMDVYTKTRKLKGRITQEVLQDLRAVHGLDANAELANILQAEISAEIDREIVLRIVAEAKTGAQNCSIPGTFDFHVDADGRWSMEKVMSLMIQIEREATLIAQGTHRGRGNFILTSPEVAAYLSMANLITTQYQNTGFTPVINPVSTSYYGMLANRFKVFVDPYLTSVNNQHVLVVGYKGPSVYDAGLFYCPYVPIQWWTAIGEEDGGQRLGIMSRYGLVSNPYTISNPIHALGQGGTTIGNNGAAMNQNGYFRKIMVKLS